MVGAGGVLLTAPHWLKMWVIIKQAILISEKNDVLAKLVTKVPEVLAVEAQGNRSKSDLLLSIGKAH